MASMPNVSAFCVARLHTYTSLAGDSLMASTIPGTLRFTTIDVNRLPGPSTIWSAVPIARVAAVEATASAGCTWTSVISPAVVCTAT